MVVDRVVDLSRCSITIGHQVFLEIGGNDLFAPTPPAQFRGDLAELLNKVVRPNRTVIMLELPLFPWDARYGRIQRELARSFSVVLIPKRFFVGILRDKGSTLDLAHLSAQGHQKMADDVADLLGIAGKVPRQDGRQR
jgi:lysophospholipase L1-like esterase